MIIHAAHKTELKPNNRQKTHLSRHAGTARFAYNWGLARRIEEYKKTGRWSNAIEQHRQLNALKGAEFPWMYEVSKCAPQEALRDLDSAYRNAFARIRNGAKSPGFPRFKTKKRGKGSFRLTGSIRVFEEGIQLPSLGFIRLKEKGYIPAGNDGDILSATCSEKGGKWYVSVLRRVEVPEPEAAEGEAVGVDLGIKSTAVASDGRVFPNPKALDKSLCKLIRFQRKLSRQQKGSKNRHKTAAKIGKCHRRIADIRRDSLHKATSAICKAKTKPSVIVLEELNVKGMSGNRRLSRTISDAGMGEFRRQIEYKAAQNGIRVMTAPRFFPSSCLCSVCGAKNENLKLADRSWKCGCGAEHDRDLNAAINLRLLADTASSAGIYACGDTYGGGTRKNPRSTSYVSEKQEADAEYSYGILG